MKQVHGNIYDTLHGNIYIYIYIYDPLHGNIYDTRQRKYNKE